MKNPEKEAAKARKTLTTLAAKRQEHEVTLGVLKTRKSTLVLKAHGEGNEDARDKLSVLNRQAAAATVEIDDIDVAIRQAEANLKEAEQAIAEAQEFERLKKLRALCEKILESGEVIEEKGKAMMLEVAAYAALFNTARQLLGGQDHQGLKRLHPDKHRKLYLADLIGHERITRLDPRYGNSLVEMDRARLEYFMMPDKVLKGRAALHAIPGESNVVEIDEQKAASAA